MTDTTARPKSREEFERAIWDTGNNLLQMASIPWFSGQRYRRKLRLFALACFDIVRPLVSDPRSLAAVAFFERHIEKSGVVGRVRKAGEIQHRDAAAFEMRDRWLNVYPRVPMTPEQWDDTIAHFAASHLVEGDGSTAAAMCCQSAAQIRLGKWALANGYWPPDYATPAVFAASKVFEKEIIELLKDVIGDPFREVTFSPAWRTDTAVILARQMYESRDF